MTRPVGCKPSSTGLALNWKRSARLRRKSDYCCPTLLPNLNVSSTTTMQPPRWSLGTCTSNSLPLLPPPKRHTFFRRKFSQATTDTLQRALESLNARHGATISTLHTQLASTQAALANERRQSARLRDVLDEATEQLAMETYGRR